MELCQNRRGIMRDMKYMDATRVDLQYELPLGEIVYDLSLIHISQNGWAPCWGSGFYVSLSSPE